MFITSLAMALLQQPQPQPPQPAQANPACDIPNVSSVQVVENALPVFLRRSETGECRAFLAPPPGMARIQLRIVYKKPLAPGGGVAAPDGPIDQTQQIEFTEGVPKRDQIVAVVGNNESADLPISITFAPSLSLLPSQSCGPFLLCVIAGAPSSVGLQVSRPSLLAEGAALLKRDDGAVERVAFTLAEPYPVVTIPAHLELLDIRSYALEIPLKEESLIDGTVRKTIVLDRLRAQIAPRRRTQITLDFGGRTQPVVFVGEIQPVRLSMTGGSVAPNTYELTEPSKPTDPVAVLRVADAASGTLIVQKETSLGGGRVPVTLIGGSGNNSFRVTLQAMRRPQVNSAAVVPQSRSYTDGKLRPGVPAIVTVTGANASAFTGKVRPEEGSIREIIPHVQLPGERSWEITPHPSLKATKLDLQLRAEGVDTVISLGVVPNQRPRNLDFVTLQYRKGPASCIRTTTKPIQVQQAGETLACGLGDLRLTFDPGVIDSDNELYGPQYLKVEAQIRGPDHKVLETKSINWVVAPDGYPVSGDYHTGRELALTDLIGSFGRYSQPGSRVTISVAHDATQYQQATGTRHIVSVRDARRISVTGGIGVSPFMGYVAKIRRESVERQPLLNGSPRDSLVRIREHQDWKADAASIAFSAALEFQYLTSTGKPTPLALRFGGLLMDSPYEAGKKRGALALSVPIRTFSVTGNLDFSIGAGPVFMPGERTFYALTSLLQLSTGGKP